MLRQTCADFATNELIPIAGKVDKECQFPMEEISRGCATAGVIVSAHNSLYLAPLISFANDDQAKKYIAPFVSGNFLHLKP